MRGNVLKILGDNVALTQRFISNSSSIDLRFLQTAPVKVFYDNTTISYMHKLIKSIRTPAYYEYYTNILRFCYRRHETRLA